MPRHLQRSVGQALDVLQLFVLVAAGAVMVWFLGPAFDAVEPVARDQSTNQTAMTGLDYTVGLLWGNYVVWVVLIGVVGLLAIAVFRSQRGT